jgi:hypothetical protein
MKRLVAAVATALALSGAQANTVTTDFTDLWYIPAESGWGANVIQQQDILFITLFVYGQNNQPTWYVGSAVQYQGLQNGQFTFTGSLFQTTGPYFGAGTFNPANVTNRQVGSITFRTGTSTTATITYTVDGVSVTKNVQRQTFRNQDFSGQYRGAVIGSYSGCSSGNGPYESPAILTVTQNNTSIQIAEAGGGGTTAYTCNYTGTITFSGNASSAAGSGVCSDGFAQTWSTSEMKVGLDFFAAAFSARLGGANSSCVFTGRIGGLRRNN